ncbi:MAG: hypothetical protein R3A52_00585 [Polyangiales bacterium]
MAAPTSKLTPSGKRTAASANHSLFSERSVEHRGCDAVADGEVGHAVSHRGHHARDLAAGRERELGLELVFPSREQHVGEVHPAAFTATFTSPDESSGLGTSSTRSPEGPL